MTQPDVTAEALISRFGLVAHPEGGHYRETFRDPVSDVAGRSRVTAIYFLLDAGETSRWHRVDATEIWLWHAGGPLQLSFAATDAAGSSSVPEESGRLTTIDLGSDVGAGQQPQAVVPAHAWQQAHAGSSWCLVSCVVAPGFQFEGFELAPPSFHPAQDA